MNLWIFILVGLKMLPWGPEPSSSPLPTFLCSVHKMQLHDECRDGVILAAKTSSVTLCRLFRLLWQKYHRLGGLHTSIYFSVLGAGKSKIKVVANLVSAEGSCDSIRSWGLWETSSWKAIFLLSSRSGRGEGALIPFMGPTLMT